MKIVFMGTPEFATTALKSLVEEGHEIAAVVTQPDRPKDRGHMIKYSSVKEYALHIGINKILQPIRVKDESFVKILKEIQPDVIVVVAFGQIINKDILEIPKYGCINIHASLLPKYRGAAPIQWAVINGESESGVTTMQMDEGLDTGDILEQIVVKLDPNETGGSLHDKLAQEGGYLILSTLKKLEKGLVQGRKQEDHLSNYAKKLDKKIGKIDFSKDAFSIHRLIRGLNPWPSAYTSFHGKTMKIWNTEVVDCINNEKPGKIIEIRKDALRVGTGKGCLDITQIQLQGKKKMLTKDFLKGNSVDENTVLGEE